MCSRFHAKTNFSNEAREQRQAIAASIMPALLHCTHPDDLEPRLDKLRDIIPSDVRQRRLSHGNPGCNPRCHRSMVQEPATRFSCARRSNTSGKIGGSAMCCLPAPPAKRSPHPCQRNRAAARSDISQQQRLRIPPSPGGRLSRGGPGRPAARMAFGRYLVAAHRRGRRPAAQGLGCAPPT